MRFLWGSLKEGRDSGLRSPSTIVHDSVSSELCAALQARDELHCSRDGVHPLHVPKCSLST